MKTLLKIVLAVVVLVWLALFFFAGPIIKNSINTAGPLVMKVPVSVGHVKAYPLRGLISVNDLVIGNPEGFKTESLFNLKHFNVEVKLSSLFTDTIVVKDITILGAEVTYEATLSGSNIGALQKQLEGEPKNDKTPKDEPKKEEKPAAAAGKKVIIEKFAFNEGRVNLSIPGMMGTALPLPLPPINMKDIGKESDGASFTDVIREVFSAIFSAVTSVVTSSGKLLGDGAKAVGQGAAAVGGAAVDGAAAVGGAVGDAGKAVGRGVANAAGSVIGIFGGSKDKAESTEEKGE